MYWFSSAFSSSSVLAATKLQSCPQTDFFSFKYESLDPPPCHVRVWQRRAQYTEILSTFVQAQLPMERVVVQLHVGDSPEAVVKKLWCFDTSNVVQYA